VPIAPSRFEHVDIGFPPTPRDVLIDYLQSIGVENPKKVERALLQEFGSISSLLGASWRRLCRAVGQHAAAPIHASRRSMQSALEKPIMARPLISSRNDLHQYLRFRLGRAPRESLLAFFLDSGLRLIRIDKISSGSITETKLELTKIVVRGATLGASAFLLVHNHPSGDPRPSLDDIKATARIRYISKELDMPLIDHLIVAGGEFRSVGDW
jgi:DNA repair protein RadC